MALDQQETNVWIHLGLRLPKPFGWFRIEEGRASHGSFFRGFSLHEVLYLQELEAQLGSERSGLSFGVRKVIPQTVWNGLVWSSDLVKKPPNKVNKLVNFCKVASTHWKDLPNRTRTPSSKNKTAHHKRCDIPYLCLFRHLLRFFQHFFFQILSNGEPNTSRFSSRPLVVFEDDLILGRLYNPGKLISRV